MGKGCPTRFGVSFMPPASCRYNYYIAARRRKHNRTGWHKPRTVWPARKMPQPIQMEAQTTVPQPRFPEENRSSGGLRPRNREKFSLLSEFICHNNSISAQKSQASPAVRLFRLVGNRRFRGRFSPFIQSFVFPSSRRPRKLLFFRDLKSIRKVIFIYPISWFFAFINRYFLDFSCVKTTLYELSVYM